jgi:hypothetical protein
VQEADGDERDKARKQRLATVTASLNANTQNAPSNELVFAYCELIEAVKLAYTTKKSTTQQQSAQQQSSSPNSLKITQKNTNPQYSVCASAHRLCGV